VSLGEADRDRRASCFFYTKGARRPKPFGADQSGTNRGPREAGPHDLFTPVVTLDFE